MINGSVINGAAINGGIALDEEAYQLWLRNPSASVCHLVWIDYNGTSAVYPNWVRYTLKVSDMPFAGHRDRVKNIGSFSQQIGDRFSGVVTASIGEIEFDNADGTLDEWHKLAVDGQRVKVLHGDPSWDVDRFRLVYECIAEAFVSSDNLSLRLRVRSPSYQYNLPIQTNLVGTTTVNSTSNLPIPRAFGKVPNAEPLLVDSANLVYQWNDGAVTSVDDVRDGGIPFRTSPIAISSVVGNLMSTATAHGFSANTRVRCDAVIPAANAIAYSITGGWLCAVGPNTCYTSIDSGLTWVARTIPAGDYYGLYGTGAGILCAVGINVCATSADGGVTWEARTIPAGSYFSITIAALTSERLVAVGASVCATSDDYGATWTSRTIPAGTYEDVEITGSAPYTLCAVGGSVCATSDDGITWTARTIPAGAYYALSVINAGGNFCAIGATICATSDDGGVTWTARTAPAGTYEYVIWTGYRLCAAGAGVSAISDDYGVTWTNVTFPGAVTCYAMIQTGLWICAVGVGLAISGDAHGESWTAISDTLPTPLANTTDYWISADGLTTTAFKLSATRGGTVVTLTNTTTGASIIGYHWTADLTTGKVQMSSSPTGVITLDGEAGGLLAADLVVGALSATNVAAGSQVHFQNTNVDMQSYLRFESTCPQTMGVYVKDRRNRLDVANDVVRGIGAWYGYGREGMLRFGRVEGNPSSYDFALIESDFFTGTLRIEQLLPPEKQHRIGYRKNWTNQSGALFAAVSADNRELYSLDMSVTQSHTSADAGTNGSFHALNMIPDVQESLIYLASDANDEAVRLDAMYYGWGAIFTGEVGRIGTEIDVGHTVNVTYPRFGLSGGVNMTCVGFDDNRTSGKVTLKFFVALANYTPGQL